MELARSFVDLGDDEQNDDAEADADVFDDDDLLRTHLLTSQKDTGMRSHSKIVLITLDNYITALCEKPPP